MMQQSSMMQLFAVDEVLPFSRLPFLGHQRVLVMAASGCVSRCVIRGRANNLLALFLSWQFRSGNLSSRETKCSYSSISFYIRCILFVVLFSY